LGRECVAIAMLLPDEIGIRNEGTTDVAICSDLPCALNSLRRDDVSQAEITFDCVADPEVCTLSGKTPRDLFVALGGEFLSGYLAS
jgi:hypothetical protein